MRTIFSAVKTGVVNGIAGAISFAIVWKTVDIMMDRSLKREIGEAEKNAKEFFSNLWELVKSLIKR